MGSTPFACSMFKRRNLFKSLIGVFLAPDIPIVPNIPIVPRRLKTTWSFEAEQDLVSLHGFSIDSGLVSSMAEELQKEIDSEMIERIRKMPM